jgi:hypothetical protein
MMTFSISGKYQYYKWVKLSLYMKGCGGSRGIAPLIFNLALDGQLHKTAALSLRKDMPFNSLT